LKIQEEKSPDTASNYVTYLLNEMTIMGILSTFCVVVIGGFITVFSNVSKDSALWLRDFWREEGAFVLFGLTAVLIAAFLFYRQRSILSYYVGQIYLSVYDSAIADGSAHELHERANNWITWRFYRLAFLCLFTAAALLGRVALVETPISGGFSSSFLQRMRTWELWVPPAVCIVLCVWVCIAFAAFPNADHPYAQSFRHPKRFLKGLPFLLKGGLE
jgi:hypothetical protein